MTYYHDILSRHIIMTWKIIKYISIIYYYSLYRKYKLTNFTFTDKYINKLINIFKYINFYINKNTFKYQNIYLKKYNVK